MRDMGIAAATAGLAAVRVVRARSGVAATFAPHDGELLLMFVLSGVVGLDGHTFGRHRLKADDSCVIPAGAGYVLTAAAGAEMLQVTLPAS